MGELDFSYSGDSVILAMGCGRGGIGWVEDSGRGKRGRTLPGIIDFFFYRELIGRSAVIEGAGEVGREDLTFDFGRDVDVFGVEAGAVGRLHGSDLYRMGGDVGVASGWTG